MLPSAAYARFQKEALWYLRLHWRREAIDGLVAVCATFYRDRDVGDLDNYEKALGDVLQRGCVLTNDRNIRSWDGTRALVDRAQPRVEVLLSRFDA